jgi:hypothetical protein
VTRVRLLVLAATLGALGLVAGPALSLQTYRPGPVEFEMAATALSGAGPGVSEPMRAPKRFNLVGLTWKGGPREPAIALRTRSDGGDWTPWTPISVLAEDGPDPGTDESDGDGMTNPVWAGEADWVQYRSSEELPALELHFVNTAGTATAGDRLRTTLRGAVNTAFVSIAGAVAAGPAGAAESQPAIVAREEWGADACPPRTSASYGQVRAAYVHHTVNPNDYTEAEAPQIVLAICRYHRNTNGWNDIGYNFLVDRFGTIYEGRAGGIEAAVIGAQAEGFNSYSTGIANIGTFEDGGQSAAALQAMARLIRWKLPLHGYPTTGEAVMVSAGGGTSKYPAGTTARVPRVLGHRDTNATACPGSALYAQLEELRAMVGGVAAQGTATVLDAGPTGGSSVYFGSEATIAGTLRTAAGDAISGQPVNVQVRVAGRWRTSSAPVTRSDGSFEAALRPKVTRAVRARFAGAGDLRASIAPTETLTVRPAVRFGAIPSRGRRGRTVSFSGRVTPRMRVYQVLRVKRGSRYRRVGVKALRPNARGLFRGSFVPAGRGIYRVSVVAKATALRGRGTSGPVDVGVGVAPPPVPSGGGLRAR